MWKLKVSLVPEAKNWLGKRIRLYSLILVLMASAMWQWYLVKFWSSKTGDFEYRTPLHSVYQQLALIVVLFLRLEKKHIYPSTGNVVQEGDKKGVWGTEWRNSRNILVDKTWHTGQCTDGIAIGRACWILAEKLYIFKNFEVLLTFIMDELHFFFQSKAIFIIRFTDGLLSIIHN